jgi:type IVB pilus formation R64 PilN family outer membrane protein
MQTNRVNTMLRTTLALAVSTALLAGCASTKLSADAQNNINEAKLRANAGFAKAQTTLSKAAQEEAQEVDTPYILGKSVPLSRQVTLPPALQKGVKTAMMFPDSWVSLSGAAERIMLATGIVVTIAPDVYLDQAALARRSAKETSTAPAAPSAPSFVAMPAAGQVPLPTPLGTTSTAVASFNASSQARPPESAHGFDLPKTEAPLSQILDVIAARLGINWKYDDHTGSIRFYRLVTKSWPTPFSSASSDYTTTLEGGTSQSSNSNAIAQRQSQSPIKTEHKNINELNSIRDAVESVMTRAGSINANPATGTITVTDTVEAIEAADELVLKEIRALSRMVVLRVQTVQVTTNNSSEGAVNVTAVINKALQRIPDLNMTWSSPAAITSTNSGSFGVSVLSGPAEGSAAVIKALHEIGDVQTSTELPLSTRNRQPVYYNVRNTFSYVSGTTAAAATTGGTGGTPGLTTAQDSVGLKLMLYPNVTPKDTVMLTMAMDQSILQSLSTFSSGSGTNVQSVQLPNVNGEGSSQLVPIKNGETIVLTGFDRLANQYDKRTLGDKLPVFAGGSARASETRATTIVLVSATIYDID